MKKIINWHKIFNNQDFFYCKDSYQKIKTQDISKYSYELAKIIYPQLTYYNFLYIVTFISKFLDIEKNRSILDFGSGNGAFLNYLIKKYKLKDCYSLEISRPLINFQKSNQFLLASNLKFYQTHHLNYKIFTKIEDNIVDYSMCNSVFQYFYNNSYSEKVIDFLIRSTKKNILIYDIKNYKKKNAYKETVRERQNLTKIEFNKKYKNTPIKFYSKLFFKRILYKLRKKYNFNYQFIPLPVQALDSNFGYCLLIKKNF